MENYQDKEKFYLTSDLKLQAFLRLMTPEFFIGLNKTNPNRITFVFKKTEKLIELTNGYLSRKKYLISPLSLSENIEQGKAMIYGNY